MTNKLKINDKQELVLKILGYILLALSVGFTLFVIFARLSQSVAESAFFKSVDIFTSQGEFNAWIRALSYIVCVFTISYCGRNLLSLAFCWLKKGKSIVSLVCSFIKYIAVIVVIFFILSSFGVDTDALIAGIGILSLIVGLAIQPLLQDVIAGVFIVFEKTFDVGDVVVVDGFRGTVIEVGIRTTKIKDAGGDIKVINNSDVRTLINMTNDLSLAISEVDIEYGESLEHVEKVIETNLDLIKEKIPAIVDGPYYSGVVALGAHGVTLRLIAQCKEEVKFQTQRDINRQIKLIFDANEIGIAYPQVVVHKPQPISKKNIIAGETDAFVLEQNMLSKEIAEEENH